MVGLGTIINVAAIVIGSLIGVGLGNRLPERTRAVVTDSLGMLVLVIAALNIVALRVLRIKSVAVGDLLPALIIAPILTVIVATYV